MTSDAVLAEFDRLVGKAEALIDDLERDREPEFDAVLAHVLAHPAERSNFASRFMQVLLSSATDGDLFEFCMHELRWPEVKHQVEAAIQEAANKEDRRSQFWLGGVAQAFRDDWSDGRGIGYKRFA